ncbi:MAG: DJ-1/PfpI family protein [Oscillospiraceae bacterium]|nr:DJ-1/PfpI family protein [Oscillospiraceae bacterium]
MIYVFLAEGFEEIEAITPVDCLRRAGQTVQTVGVGGKVIKGSHGIPVTADITADEIRLDDALEMIVLPGGMPGTVHLGESAAVQKAIAFCDTHDKWIAAICAAPSVLGALGLLSGKKATCYPGFEDSLKGCTAIAAPAVRDGRFITGRGPGAAMDFALELVSVLTDTGTAEKLAAGMVYEK